MAFSRLTRRFLLLASCLLSLLPIPARGQSTLSLTWHGEVRPRFESREPVEGAWRSFTSMRTRLELDVIMEEGLRLFFQPQDVRVWGGETSERDRSADNLDVHQAFLDVVDVPGIGGFVRVGRQEVALAEARLIAAPDWGQAGQSFDGARWVRSAGRHRLEVLVIQVAESATPTHDHEARLYGASWSGDAGAWGRFDAYVLRDQVDGAVEHGQNLVGGVWNLTLAPLAFRAQGILESGTRGGRDVDAFLLAGRARLALAQGRGQVALGYDYLSGDPEPEDGVTRVFSTLFGARHRYYGRADYFADIPFHTAGLGLQDLALKMAWRPEPDLGVNLDLHAFRTAVQGPAAEQRMGEEMDLWLRYRLREHLDLEGGLSLARAGPVMEALGRLQGTGTFAYVMTSVWF